MSNEEKIAISFLRSELTAVVAEYYGFNESDVNLDDYSEKELKDIIFDRIM